MRYYLYPRFYGSTTGPQGGSALKTGIDRVEVSLRHESYPARIEVAGSLVDGIPRVLIRAWEFAHADERLVHQSGCDGVRERIFLDSSISEVFEDPNDLQGLTKAMLRAYYSGDSRALDDAAEALRSLMGWDSFDADSSHESSGNHEVGK